MKQSSSHGLSVIFHSGGYDRVYNGLSFALTAAAVNRPVRLLFTYWSLRYLTPDYTPPNDTDSPHRADDALIETKRKAGALKSVKELLGDAKQLGIEFYGCGGSMTLLKLEAEDLIKESAGEIGAVEFLKLAEEDQLLFI